MGTGANPFYVAPSPSSSSLSTGVIIGIAVGAGVLLLIGVVLTVWYCKRKSAISQETDNLVYNSMSPLE